MEEEKNEIKEQKKTIQIPATKAIIFLDKEEDTGVTVPIDTPYTAPVEAFQFINIDNVLKNGLGIDFPRNALYNFDKANIDLISTMTCQFITRNAFDIFCNMIDNSPYYKILENSNIKFIANNYLLGLNNSNNSRVVTDLSGLIKNIIEDYFYSGIDYGEGFVFDKEGAIPKETLENIALAKTLQIKSAIFAALSYAIDDAINELFITRCVGDTVDIMRFTMNIYKRTYNIKDITNPLNYASILASFVKRELAVSLDKIMALAISPSIDNYFRNLIYTGYYFYRAIDDTNTVIAKEEAKESKPLPYGLDYAVF